MIKESSDAVFKEQYRKGGKTYEEKVAIIEKLNEKRQIKFQKQQEEDSMSLERIDKVSIESKSPERIDSLSPTRGMDTSLSPHTKTVPGPI